MNILMDMLLDEVHNKMNVKKLVRSPYVIERSNHYQYKYALQRAQRYPRKWIENQLNAKVILTLNIKSDEIKIRSINIISKSKELDNKEIIDEVEKTLALAQADFPKIMSNESNVSLPLNWVFNEHS